MGLLFHVLDLHLGLANAGDGFLLHRVVELRLNVGQLVRDLCLTTAAAQLAIKFRNGIRKRGHLTRHVDCPLQGVQLRGERSAVAGGGAIGTVAFRTVVEATRR